MARVKIKLDHGGMREMLQSAGVRAELAERAEAVADTVRAHQSIVRNEMPVGRDSHTADRAVESVSIEHPGGIAADAKYGILSGAAREHGLDVTAGKVAATARKRAETRRKRAAETPEQRERRRALAAHRRELRRLRERDRWAL